jgi:hypothetical protein
MLYLRTAAGGFVNAATIVQLSPQRGGDEITGWIAICADDKAVALAAYYATPGRIEKDLQHLLPREGTVPPHRRASVGGAVAPLTSEAAYCTTTCCFSGS